MATRISNHTAARHTGITGPSGSTAACSSDPALGSTVLTTSTATWITVSIHITATMVHIRTVETRPLITSTETRCVMGAATEAEAMEAAAIEAGAIPGRGHHRSAQRAETTALKAAM